MSTKIGTLTRALAIDALTHIMTRHQHSDVVLQRLFDAQPHLRPLDKAFIFEMVFGALRWMSKMDWIMSHIANRPFSSLDPRVANALRVGAYQIYYMDRVPERAAVSETVEAVKNVGIPNAAPFVNAVLRRVAKKSEYFPKPDKTTHYLDYCAMQYAHPLWMVKRWSEFISKERFEYVLANNNKQPPLTLKRITRKSFPQGDEGASFSHYILKHHGIESNYLPIDGALKVDSMIKFEHCEAFKQGCYIVQDESAQLTAGLLKIEDGDQVLDACAAPGGKSIFMWDRGLDPKNLTVCDSSKKRMNMITENFARVGLEGATVLRGDVLKECQGKVYDKILLDAPCSALGVIRRHPEIKWQRSLNDIINCAQKQKELLDGLAGNLKPGGEMVYIVCSFEPEETTQQIDAFLASHPEFETVSLADRVHDYYQKYVTKQNELLLYSGNTDDLDGFYAVVLKKNK